MRFGCRRRRGCARTHGFHLWGRATHHAKLGHALAAKHLVPAQGRLQVRGGHPDREPADGGRHCLQVTAHDRIWVGHGRHGGGEGDRLCAPQDEGEVWSAQVGGRGRVVAPPGLPAEEGDDVGGRLLEADEVGQAQRHDLPPDGLNARQQLHVLPEPHVPAGRRGAEWSGSVPERRSIGSGGAATEQPPPTPPGQQGEARRAG